MLTLIAAAAVAAAQPATAPAQPMQMGQMDHSKMDRAGEQKGMDCCKECSKQMAMKHEGDAAGHAEHKDR